MWWQPELSDRFHDLFTVAGQIEAQPKASAALAQRLDDRPRHTASTPKPASTTTRWSS